MSLLISMSRSIVLCSLSAVRVMLLILLVKDLRLFEAVAVTGSKHNHGGGGQQSKKDGLHSRGNWRADSIGMSQLVYFVVAPLLRVLLER